MSVFTPWDAESYVVVDVPEAIWSNLGLLYLAHHDSGAAGLAAPAPPPTEWTRLPGGGLSIEQTLENGIRFGASIAAEPEAASVRMELWLTNGTDDPIEGLDVQACVMLGAANGFQRQTADNRVVVGPFIAAPIEPARDRWVITAWEPLGRVWANPPCPCIHADPRIPDCPPGETRSVAGVLALYEGRDIEAEIARLQAHPRGRADI